MVIVKEYEEMLQAYAKAGGERDALKSKEIANLTIHKNKVLSANEVKGIKIETKEIKTGVNINFGVEEGAKIGNPVHLCFGVLPREGLQEIILRVNAQQGSEINVIAHCIFPNAVNVIHKMDADIEIGDNAKFNCKETHYHGEFGGVKVIPKAKVKVGKRGVWESTFALIQGCVGMLDYDFEVFGGKKSITELMVKVFGKKEDDIRIAERIHLDGREARWLAKSRLVLNDNAKAYPGGGQSVNAECRGEFVKQGQFDIAQAKPIMHIAGRRFAVAEKIIQPKTQ